MSVNVSDLNKHHVNVISKYGSLFCLERVSADELKNHFSYIVLYNNIEIGEIDLYKDSILGLINFGGDFYYQNTNRNCSFQDLIDEFDEALQYHIEHCVSFLRVFN